MTLTLRPLEPTDLDHFFRHGQDPTARTMAAFVPEDPFDRVAFDQHWTKIQADPQVRIRTITLDGEPIGHIASFIMFGKREITYWLDRAVWGRGLATAALRQFLEMETERPLHARTVDDNVGSQRVLQKCGFVQVGEDQGEAHMRGGTVRELVWRLDLAG